MSKKAYGCTRCETGTYAPVPYPPPDGDGWRLVCSSIDAAGMVYWFWERDASEVE